MKIKPYYLVALIFVILLIFVLIQFNVKDEDSNKESTPQSDLFKKTSVKYFSSSSDKVVISTGSQTLYTDNPITTLTYYAIDNSNNLVYFKEGDKAFVRILGISNVFSNNIEIFHPESKGIKDDTIFSGEITFPKEGVYLVKVCLGKSINLDSEGNKVWPFGCFEDQTSVQVNVYENN